MEYIAERASGLSELSLDAVLKMIEAMRRAEGLDQRPNLGTNSDVDGK
ncbi:hypothetical protein [Nonomuraea sp. LPB2021202275-12-8]